MSWYLTVLKKYGVFFGRARRKEYWMFALMNVLVAVAIAIVGVVVPPLRALSYLYSLGVMIPGLAVSVRRLHDTGRSGWWIFIAFVPIIGGLVLLLFMVQDSNPEHNQYGPNPKAA